jgi:flagellar motor protein MotB
VVYASALSFPSGSAELVGEFQSRVDREMRELLPAVAGLPEAAGWRLQVDSYSGQAASEAGIAIDAWELALLRVASVTEYLIQAGVPPDRITVRFLAGFAGHEGEAGTGSDLELKLICCES